MLKFLVVFSVFFLYMSVPVGFDLFHHVFTYDMGYELSQRTNAGHDLFGIINLPRYLALSTIYNFSSLIGVPIFICITLLVSAPLYSISCEFISRQRIKVSDLFLLSFSFLFVLFFSGLSLSMLWFIAFFYTKKKVFAFGFFHPVSLFLVPVYLLINRALFFTYIVAFSLYLLLIFYLPFYPATTLKKGINISSNFDDLMGLAEYAIAAKAVELYIISIFLLLFYFTRNLYIFSINYKNAVTLLVLIAFSSIFLVANKSLKYYLFNGHPELMAHAITGINDDYIYGLFTRLRDN